MAEGEHTLGDGPRSESSGQGSFPSLSASSTDSVSTPTAFSFGACITGDGTNTEVNTIRLPTLDDDSDEEDVLPLQGSSRYGSFAAPRDDIAFGTDPSNAADGTLGAKTGESVAGRKSHNLAHIVIPGMEDTVKFGAGNTIQINSDHVSPDADPEFTYGYDTRSSSGYGSGSGSGFNSGYGLHSRWNGSGTSSPTTIKFQASRHTDHGTIFPETGFAPSPLAPRPGIRRAETENPADMRRPQEQSMAELSIAEAPDYAPDETFSFPSRPSSPFGHSKVSGARLFNNPGNFQQSSRQHSGDMPLLPSEPVRIDAVKPPSMPVLPRMHSSFSLMKSGKMSEPPTRITPMAGPGLRPSMPRQASVAVMDGVSTMNPGTVTNHPAAAANAPRHRHRGSKVSQGSGDSGRSYSLVNDPNHAYPMPLSAQSSSGSASMSRDRSRSTGGTDSEVSSIVGYDVAPLSSTLDLREALKVIFMVSHVSRH